MVMAKLVKKALTTKVTIAEAVGELRSQLAEVSRQLAADEHHRFVTKNVEVELAITFKAASEGAAGRWLLDTFDERQMAGGTKHKLKLMLELTDRSVKISSSGESIVRNEDYKPPR